MVRIGAIADIHAHAGNEPALRGLFERAQADADLLIVAGDLTDTGLEDEAKLLAKVHEEYDIPMAVVLGNHDFHHDQQVGIRKALEKRGIVVLDGEGWTFEHNGVKVGVAGSVGFGGGFRPYGASPFGEPEWKYLYAKIVEETRKLDRGLAAVSGADHIIAMTHYSPTADTMGDEPEALHPYLGSSELGDAIERHNVLLAVHGHAHRGRLEGCTTNGIPVFNVAVPIVDCPVVWNFEAPGENGSKPPTVGPILVGAGRSQGEPSVSGR